MSDNSGDDPSSNDERDRLSDQQFPDSDSESRSFNVEELADAVREDPPLDPEEKGWNIYGVKVDDDASFFFEIAGPMRRLIKHRHVQITKIRVRRDDGSIDYIQPHRFKGRINCRGVGKRTARTCEGVKPESLRIRLRQHRFQRCLHPD